MPKTNEIRVNANKSNVLSTSSHETANLVSVLNNTAVTTSLIVAEYFGKSHKSVLRAIRNLECSAEFNQRNFAPVEYKDAKGELRPMYYLTRDGFTLLAMGFTGKIAAIFKEAYINAFNEMEGMLRKGEYTKYAEKLLSNEVKRFNKRLKEIAMNMRNQKGIEYGTYGEIKACVAICDSLPLDKQLRNVFTQIRNAYVEGYNLSGKYINSEKQNIQMRKLLSEFGGRLAEDFRIYPNL